MTDPMPDSASLDAIRRSPPGPNVPPNLLEYREPGGGDAFGRYGGIPIALIQEADGQAVFGGCGGPVLTGSEVAWDDVLVVRFPSADAFPGMIESDACISQAAPIRYEALEATLWMAMHPFRGFEGE